GCMGDFEIIDNHRAGKIVIQLNCCPNSTVAISPRYESWVNSLLPAHGSCIILNHEEARKAAGVLLG
ncbi:40S ribosomal protein S22, partial [Leucoagaricus sp. SymC.cos]